MGFELFCPPSPLKNGLWGKKFVNIKKIEVVPNCLKWRENWSKMMLNFLPPPPFEKWMMKGVKILINMVVDVMMKLEGMLMEVVSWMIEVVGMMMHHGNNDEDGCEHDQIGCE